jgi:hypothetical protein
VLSCVVDHILQEFNTLFLTRFRTYKIASPPQTKAPVKTTFRDCCLYSFFVQVGQCNTNFNQHDIYAWLTLKATARETAFSLLIEQYSLPLTQD